MATIKGDGKFCAIAAASILAKTYRDDFMKKIHSQFPEYDWVNNKGYPTVKHRFAISENGITPYHTYSLTHIIPVLVSKLKYIFVAQINDSIC